MNMSKESIIKLIVTGTATFFMLIGIICNIVAKVDGWEWANTLILCIIPLALLAFAILEITTPNVIKPIYYLGVFVIMILAEFIYAIHQLVNMGESTYYKADYFSRFIIALVMIAAIVVAIISSMKYKTMFVPFIVSIVYISYTYFNNIISDFFGFWGHLFAGNKVSLIFQTFSIATTMCLSIATVVYMVYKTNKEA